MSPKLAVLLVSFFIVSISYSQKSAHLSGALEIDLSGNTFSGTYKLTRLQVDNPKMSFMLHENVEVEQVFLNGKPIASSKNGRVCNTCKVHTIWIDRSITPQDTVSIDLVADLGIFEVNEIRNSRPHNRIYEGHSRQKWYPVILEESTKKEHRSFAQNTYNYTYDLDIACSDCKEVRILEAEHYAENKFSSQQTSPDITLLLARHPIGNLSSLTFLQKRTRKLHLQE